MFIDQLSTLVIHAKSKLKVVTIEIPKFHNSEHF